MSFLAPASRIAITTSAPVMAIRRNYPSPGMLTSRAGAMMELESAANILAAAADGG
jgi:hypothetical protein